MTCQFLPECSVSVGAAGDCTLAPCVAPVPLRLYSHQCEAKLGQYSPGPLCTHASKRTQDWAHTYCLVCPTEGTVPVFHQRKLLRDPADLDTVIESQEMWLGGRMCRSVADSRCRKSGHLLAASKLEDGSHSFTISN